MITKAGGNKQTSSLTPLAIRKAKPPKSGSAFMWDGGSGLVVKMNPGSKVYIARAGDPSGRTVRRTLGRTDGDDKSGEAAGKPAGWTDGGWAEYRKEITDVYLQQSRRGRRPKMAEGIDQDMQRYIGYPD